jgi:DNA-binding NarL/FixJ family response regulator
LTIYVIDDHPLIRGALVMLLHRVRPGADVVELSRLSELDRAIASHGEPELFCLDLKLPDTNGISGVKLVKGMYPQVPLAIVSATPAGDVEAWCREAGADVYIEKSASVSEFMTALRSVLKDEQASAPDADAPASAADTKLSKRQKQLIVMLDEGLSNRDIAERLGISEHTVKVHLWRLFRRLGVKSRTQTLHFARVNGWLAH